MAKISKAIIDSALRSATFSSLNIADNENFSKVNDQTYGILLTDDNGIERYVRVKAVVAEIKDDMSAAEYMAQEIAEYTEKQADKAKRAAARADKAAKDKAARAAKAKKDSDAE
jgi:hypothetical protein